MDAPCKKALEMATGESRADDTVFQSFRSSVPEIRHCIQGGGLREKGARWYGALTTLGFINRQIAADISKEHLPER